MSIAIKLLLIAAGIAGAASCEGAGAMFEGGEAFGISASNYGSVPIENGRVDGIGEDKRRYDSQSFKKPFLGQRPSFAAASIFQDNKQRIPDRIAVSWLDYPGDGKPAYTGKMNGPFEVYIRSKIPNKVLEISRKRMYSIEISVNINDGPITMEWALHRVPDSPADARYLCVGGDHFATTGQRSFNPLSARQGADPVGVWPNCKLP